MPMKHIFCFTVLFLTFALRSQTSSVKSKDSIGAIINEKLEVYDLDGKITYLKIPNKGLYNIVYRYKGTDPRKVETIDSVRALEDKIVNIILGGMIGEVRVICLSYDTKEGVAAWQEKIKKEQPFKKSSKYEVVYYNTGGNAVTEKRCRELFTKVTLFGPDGMFISYSATIAKFRWYLKDEKIVIKGKIVAEDNGKDEPLHDVDVHVEAWNKDTLAKGKTDQYGDFAMKIPNSDTSYTIRANPKNNDVKKMALLTQEGKKVSIFRKTNKGFEYKLFKADMLELAEMKVNEDIDISFKKFEGTKEKELVVIEDIIYGKDKYAVEKDAEEILNKVVEIMLHNARTNLEIVSHTDSQGDDASNLTLSQKRASAVAEYLVSKNISKGRITATGKGETQIRNRCTNGVGCSDKEHGYNRRTEFKFSK
jgi:outer membrane protein OmpA-like peptidoglycan-associated protein